MENPNGSATKRQLWALFCATKEDHREKGLSKQQASDLLSALNKKSGFKGKTSKQQSSKTTKTTKKTKKTNGAKALFEEACQAGEEAASATKPTPMIVSQHVNPLDDNSPVKESFYAPSGVCGFAWVNVKCNTPANRSFINALKKAGLAGEDHSFEWAKDSYLGGYTHWISYGNQSYELKCTYSGGFVGVLCARGIEAYGYDRLD